MLWAGKNKSWCYKMEPRPTIAKWQKKIHSKSTLMGARHTTFIFTFFQSKIRLSPTQIRKMVQKISISARDNPVRKFLIKNEKPKSGLLMKEFRKTSQEEVDRNVYGFLLTTDTHGGGSNDKQWQDRNEEIHSPTSLSQQRFQKFWFPMYNSLSGYVLWGKTERKFDRDIAWVDFLNTSNFWSKIKRKFVTAFTTDAHLVLFWHLVLGMEYEMRSQWNGTQEHFWVFFFRMNFPNRHSHTEQLSVWLLMQTHDVEMQVKRMSFFQDGPRYTQRGLN